jgi:hypothetical protein
MSAQGMKAWLGLKSQRGEPVGVVQVALQWVSVDGGSPADWPPGHGLLESVPALQVRAYSIRALEAGHVDGAGLSLGSRLQFSNLGMRIPCWMLVTHRLRFNFPSLMSCTLAENECKSAS